MLLSVPFPINNIHFWSIRILMFWKWASVTQSLSHGSLAGRSILGLQSLVHIKWDPGHLHGACLVLCLLDCRVPGDVCFKQPNHVLQAGCEVQSCCQPSKLRAYTSKIATGNLLKKVSISPCCKCMSELLKGDRTKRLQRRLIKTASNHYQPSSEKCLSPGCFTLCVRIISCVIFNCRIQYKIYLIYYLYVSERNLHSTIKIKMPQLILLGYSLNHDAVQIYKPYR